MMVSNLKYYPCSYELVISCRIVEINFFIFKKVHIESTIDEKMPVLEKNIYLYIIILNYENNLYKNSKNNFKHIFSNKYLFV